VATPALRGPRFPFTTRPSLLLLSNDAAGVIADHCTQHLELLPFALYDAQRKRLLSEDYVVVNPLGIVAAGSRPPAERGIFRFGEPHRYAVSERLALALKRSHVTNVALSRSRPDRFCPR
jgi:hypothetical protein